MKKASENVSLRRAIARGIELSTAIAAMAKELDGIKETLRSMTDLGKIVTDNGTIEFSVPEGKARVTPVEPSPCVQKGADVGLAKIVLTEGEYAMLFQEIVKPTPTCQFVPAWKMIGATKRRALSRIVCFSENTSRVTFAK